MKANEFLTSLRASLTRGEPPKMRAGYRVPRGDNPGDDGGVTRRSTPWMAMALVGGIAASVTPTSAYSQSLLGDLAEMARDAQRVLGAGESVDRANERMGRSDSARGVARDVERLLKAVDRASEKANQAGENQRERHDRWGGEPGPSDGLSP